MLRRVAAAVLALACAASAAAQPRGSVDDRVVTGANPPQLLSAYRFFTDVGARAPNTGVTPYELNTALYSDGALKFRYLYLPPNTQASYREDGVFGMPVGAVLIKTFAFAADMRRPTENVLLLETRLLVHRADGWVALPYVWNEAQTEARLSPIGATMPVRFTTEAGAEQALDWAVPNRNQCKGCHDSAGQIVPIGPTARNLNRDVGSEPQLQHWVDIGLMRGMPASRTPRFADAFDATSGTLDERARAYLHVNCAHCHNPDGPAHTSGLDLRWSADNPAHWGVLKRPVAAGRASASMAFDIAPGHPEQSILVHRMASTDPGEMMPELGRQLVDERAVQLMQEWIADMGADGHPRR